MLAKLILETGKLNLVHKENGPIIYIWHKKDIGTNVWHELIRALIKNALWRSWLRKNFPEHPSFFRNMYHTSLKKHYEKYQIKTPAPNFLENTFATASIFSIQIRGTYMLTGKHPILFEFIARPWDKYLGDLQMRRPLRYAFCIVAKNLEITRILPTGFYVDFT